MNEIAEWVEWKVFIEIVDYVMWKEREVLEALAAYDRGEFERGEYQAWKQSRRL